MSKQIANTKPDYYTVEGEPGTWSQHTCLDEAIRRATEQGVSCVWSVRFTAHRSGQTGVDKRVAWEVAS